MKFFIETLGTCSSIVLLTIYDIKKNRFLESSKPISPLKKKSKKREEKHLEYRLCCGFSAQVIESDRSSRGLEDLIYNHMCKRLIVLHRTKGSDLTVCGRGVTRN